jgi:hypothetical protein
MLFVEATLNRLATRIAAEDRTGETYIQAGSPRRFSIHQITANYSRIPIGNAVAMATDNT